MNIQALLSDKITQAMLAAGAPAECEAMVRQSAKAQFGDYQANGIMAAAKAMQIAPRQLAERVVQQLDLSEIASKTEIAGPGFINIFLCAAWLNKQCDTALNSVDLSITKGESRRVVVDYSAPNVAKEMHVGHLRSTIIGDAIARTLQFLGQQVIRANHLGDWGTQFGMLIAYLEQQQHQQNSDVELSDLEAFYRAAKQTYDNDPEFAERSRGYVVKLQGGDSQCLTLWRKLVDITIEQNQLNYQRLNVTLTRDDIMGESLYNPMLPGIVADLKQQGLAVENEGAIVVFLQQFQNKQGDPMGVIIQKKDGGYLYSTTDIACLKYRYQQLKADRIIYYTDSRQAQHMQQVWSIARSAGYVADHVQLEHHMFGMMLGKDGKPFKTRSGGTIRLADLLDQAHDRALKLVQTKNTQMDQQELHQLAEIIAVGSVKYADLSRNRTTDYVFDWENMLAFEGNTAPYLLYAYTRVISIFRKAGLQESQLSGQIQLQESYEQQLATRLLQFEETLLQVAKEGLPHLLCAYLYDVAGLFSSFYEHCPILNNEDSRQRISRLRLAALTERTLKQGLTLLGIDTVDRM